MNAHDKEKLPQRRSIRLKGFDYSSTGAYFVTICTQRYRCIFGRVVEDQVRLSHLGTVVREKWLDLPAHHPGVTLDEFIVMPNHVHGILRLRNAETGTAGRAPTVERFGRPVANSLSTIIRSYKASVTKRVRELADHRYRVWQNKFWERVIRNDRELADIRLYIRQNPLKWALDRENPEAHRGCNVNRQ